VAQAADHLRAQDAPGRLVASRGDLSIRRQVTTHSDLSLFFILLIIDLSPLLPYCHSVEFE
jgi:hypothetical protein